jgi:predicted DNA-binding transcriptional regulator YafY
MMRLHARLQDEAYPNCRTMAAELEVSPKTVQRDIDFMRDQMGLPIEYDALRNGFHYTERVTGFPAIEVSEGEVVALFVAQKALGLYQGTAFEHQLAAAFRKLTDSLRDQISFSWTEMDDAISFRSVGTTAPDLESFQEVSRAVLRSRELVFDYRKLRGAGYERRRLRPYHLGCVKNQWYAIGFDMEREEMRTFALPRMRKVKMTATRFERPVDFTISAHLRQSFGVIPGEGKPFTVQLRFDAWAGRMVMERQWHGSQRITELPSGEVELAMELGSIDEIKRWCLSWGAHVKVLAPEELVESVRTTAAAVAKMYRR